MDKAQILRSRRRAIAGFSILVATAAGFPAQGQVQKVVLENHQPFRFHMPLRMKNAAGSGETWKTGQGRAVQRSGKDLVLVPDVPARAVREIEFVPETTCVADSDLRVETTSAGVALLTPQGSLGLLAWDLILEDRSRPSGENRGRNEGTSGQEEHPPFDFASRFSPLPLSFRKTAAGPVFDTWSAEHSTAGLRLSLDLDAYHGGWLDVRGRLNNESAETTRGVYAAVVCRWEQPGVAGRTVCYDNRLGDFQGTSVTSFRAGEGHHLALQRGVDWIRTNLAGGPSTVWLNDFSESYAVRVAPKKGPRWTNANQPQLGQEAQTVGSVLYSITEITRPVIRRYADRFAPFVLPMTGGQAGFESRLVVGKQPISDERADQMFIGYTCYKTQLPEEEQLRIGIGVPHVKFGTSYFPYSTLGENFDRFKLPGQDREGYWPLSADVVNQWPLFADGIRRDLRIAKAMGFDVLRLHHLEVLYGIEPEVRQEFLDFFFGEMRALRLKALLDVQMKPDEVAELVGRYRESVDGVEIENEVLIWGINEGREKYWNAVYDAVKAVAPDIPVHLTAQSNTGIFNKLEELGGRTDRIGFHSYVDSVDAIASARGMALAVGNYAGEAGKPPVITEWNWRFLTRIPFEERAKLYPEIIGNALGTRSIPEFHQFQFIESLAMNPENLRGIRHYEPIFLSRRPKPEAFELMKLIHQYGDPSNSLHQLEIPYEVVELTGAGKGQAQVRFRNRTDRALAVNATVESFGGLTARLNNGAGGAQILPPGAEVVLPVDLETTAPLPGFYHFFLRLENSEGLLRYGWGEARLAGKPKLDRDSPTTVTYPRGVRAELDFDLSRPTTVVYGQGAPGLEVETAILVSQTLESATGRPVGMYEQGRLPWSVQKDQNLILIGTRESNALISGLGPALPANAQAYVAHLPRHDAGTRWLVLGGRTTEDAEEAAVDFVLRYWWHAKDSATRRIGSLVERNLPKGSDPARLP